MHRSEACWGEERRGTEGLTDWREMGATGRLGPMRFSLILQREMDREIEREREREEKAWLCAFGLPFPFLKPWQPEPQN
ncbi:hypothetical protein DVH24_036689 [Malus domestica]|uniref:Uncharacterized protein n=1 Tax=Malus domestica TaxID=3750 RepID=A0A498IFJ7_MALDO|nr:hypothetical protein DVH24_036689 [Malus domestica]